MPQYPNYNPFPSFQSISTSFTIPTLFKDAKYKFKADKYKVGDKVRIVKRDNNSPFGWTTPEMDETMGKVGTIEEIVENSFVDSVAKGYSISFKSGQSWIYTQSEIELVSGSPYTLDALDVSVSCGKFSDTADVVDFDIFIKV